MTAVGDKVPAPLTFERVESSIFAGLRQDWVSGENGRGVTFDLTCGAGLGSPYMTLAVHFPDGSTVHEVANVAPMITEMVSRIVGEHGKEAKQDEPDAAARDA